MKFIFPQNYKTTKKLLGLFDYSTAIFNLICYIIIFSICNLIFNSVSTKIYIGLTFSFPIFLFSIVGFNHENIVYVIIYLFKFFTKQKVYLFNKY